MNFKSDSIKKHKELADKIKESLVTEKNVIKEKEAHKAYLDNLPEGVTKEHIDSIGKYNSKFITASHVAVGELAADIFKKDKKIETVEAEVGFFCKDDKINVSVDRTKTHKSFLADTAGKEVTKDLVMKTTITTTSSKGYGLKTVRNAMSEEFADSFKK